MNWITQSHGHHRDYGKSNLQCYEVAPAKGLRITITDYYKDSY